MNRAPERLQKITLRFALPAILAFFAPGAARAAATPPQLAISPEATERLRKAGLDAKDPNLGAKLRSLAGPASSAYARSHVLSFTARSHAAVRSQLFSRAAAASVAGSPSPGPKITIPGHGTIVAGYDVNAQSNASPLGANPKISSGNYVFLVRTDQKIADLTNVSTSLSYGCSAKPGPYIAAEGWAADDPIIPGLQKLSFSNGSYPYYVLVYIDMLWIGQPRPAQMTLSFPNVVTAPYQVTLQPDTYAVTISVTVDHLPEIAGVGTIQPWGSTNISNANAKLGAPGTARVGTGAGNWQTQTTGDDLIGVGVGLTPGWKVVSAVVKSAMSVASPQDLTPDNAWRGATVTTPPSGSDLRTAVHWHYDVIDSLDYTLEWTLSGPMGQRPLLTMAKHGDCDQ